MTCTNIDQNWLKLFEPHDIYSVNTLKITNSPKFPYFSDKFLKQASAGPPAVKPTGITAITVIFTLENEAPKIEPHAMRTLLAIASETIKVKSTTGQILINNLMLQSTLKTIALENVKITELDGNILENLNILETLQLKKVSIDLKDKLVIKNSARVEITECELLPTIQYVPPSSCPEKEIILNLQKNSGFTDLDMSSMFDSSQKCKYYIDLSESQLKPDFLTIKKDVFNKIIKAGQIFLIMRETKGKLNCDGCFRKWYDKMPQYVHSVHCYGLDKNKPQFIDQFKDTELAKCNS